MRITRIMRIAFALLFVISLLLPQVSFLEVPVYAVAEEPEKVYCNATLDDEFTPNEVVVVISPSYNSCGYTVSDFSEIGCTALDEIAFDAEPGKLSRIIKLTISGDSKQNVLDAIAMLEQRADIYSAEPNYIVSFSETSVDHYDASTRAGIQYDQWAISNIQLARAWAALDGVTSQPNTVYVGVIDTGIYAEHDDLDGRVVAQGSINSTGIWSQNFTGRVLDPLEDLGDHGTRVAGIIGAIDENEDGFSGIC